MDGHQFLRDSIREFRRLKRLAERAIEQLNDEALFTRIDSESNSVGTLVKHMSGNMLSRWSEFLTSDGEKPGRDRDTEFVVTRHDDRRSLQQRWDDGWNRLFDALDRLSAEDLTRTVAIRGEPHLVTQAIQRQLTHYAYHIGQIVFLARHLVGADWQTLSIPRDRSAEFVSRPGKYLVE